MRPNILGRIGVFRKVGLKHQLGTRTHPIVNTSMIGAFARLLEMPPMTAVAEAIREEVPVSAEANIGAARDAYNGVQLIGMIEGKNVS